jgi:predicted ATPase/class 3 adenylate cyclase
MHARAVAAALAADVPRDLATKIQGAAAEMAGERRKVVVMFSDVSGFTAMSEKMDPEQVHTIMNECFQGLVEIVYKYEGYIDKFIGDCIMALFGAPVSHEDDVARSLYAIHEMTRWLNEYSTRLEEKYGVGLGMHTGLNYGTVIAGGVGSDLRMDYTVIGDTVNVASRLESRAERGQTFVSETVYAMGRRQFEFREVEPLMLKGKQHPVPAFELLGVRAAPEPLRGVEALHNVLVGRDEELALLVERLSEAKQGKGGVVSVVGEPGVGKSRLVAEFVSRAEGDGARCARAACLSYTTRVPYSVVRRLFLAWCDIEEADPPAVAEMKLTSALAGGARDLSEWEPYVRAVLVADSASAGADGLDAQTRQRLTDRALLEAALAFASKQPTAFVLDDLHWVDEDSRRVLAALVPASRETPMLVVAVYRPEFQPTWEHAADRDIIALRPFSADALNVLTEALLGDSETAGQLADLLAKKSSGNPFYVEEVLRGLIEANVLVREETGWRLTRPPASVEAPDSLHAVIMGRMDALPEESRRLLQAASVVGMAFDAWLMEELGWSLTRMLPHVERLLALQMLVEQRPLPDLRLAFPQEFLQEVSYGTLLLRTRKQMHLDVARAMERRFEGRIGEQVEVLLHHCTLGEDWSSALEYARRSAEKARLMYANASAAEFYREWLALSSRVERDAVGCALDESGALQGLGDVSALMGDYAAAEGAYQRVLDTLGAIPPDGNGAEVRRAAALRSIGNVHSRRGEYAEALTYSRRADDALAGIEGAEATAEQSRILGQIGFLLYRQGDYAAAQQACADAVALAERVESGRDMAYAHVVFGLCDYAQGRLDDALERYRQALEIRERINDLTGVAAVHQNIGNVALDQGKHAEAEEHYRRCLEIREKTGDIAGSANVYNQLGNLCLHRSDYDGAALHYGRCRDIFERIGNRFGLAVSLTNLGHIRNEQGEPHEAITCLQQAVPMVEALDVPDLLADANIALARASLDAGRADDASRLADSGLAIAVEIGSKSAQATARWVLGRLGTQRGDHAQAEEHLLASLSLFEEIGMRLWEGRASLALAELFAALGRREQATAAAEHAAEAFDELHVLSDHMRARAVLESLAKP